MSVLIKGMEIPKSCSDCPMLDWDLDYIKCKVTGRHFKVKEEPFGARRVDDCPLVPVPPHGRLIDADALVADLKRQCKEVFKTDAVSPDDFWITRNQAYNERLWTTWCESLFDYLKAVPTIIPAEEGEL